MMRLLGFEITREKPVAPKVAPVPEQSRNYGSPENPANPIYPNFGGVATSSGFEVNEQKALQLTAVYACIRIIAESVASLPIEIKKIKPNGDRENFEDHPLWNLLRNRPNEMMNGQTFHEYMTTYQAGWGNSYAVIIRDGNTIIDLLPVHPNNVRVTRVQNELFYEVADPDLPKRVVLPSRDIVHLRNLPFDITRGASPIDVARESIGLALATQTYGSKIFDRGGIQMGVLETDKVLDAEGQKRVRTSWANTYGSGGDGFGGMAILEQGLKYKPLLITPENSQFLQSRKFSVVEISRIFGVPPHMIQDLERSSFSNIEQQSLDFVQNTVRHYIKRRESEFESKLLTEREKKEISIEINMNALLRGDTQSRAEYYSKLFPLGVYTINEIRRMEGMNGIGEKGDKHYVNQTFATDEQRVAQNG